jgi:hypothetical protein
MKKLNAVASGTTGACLWELTGTSGNYTLTISGSGAMGDYSNNSNSPWYSYRNDITTLNLQQGVTTIGNWAFHKCYGLTSVTIGNSVTSIGNYVFSRCNDLTSIDVDANNLDYSSVDGVLFNKLQDTLIQYPPGKIEDYTIPNSVTSIEEGAFEYCYFLNSVTIPNSVTSIVDYAFHGCNGLTSVTIPNSVTSIGEKAFEGCSALTSVTIPNSVTSIGNYAFSNCDDLTSIDVDAGNLDYSSVDGVLFNKLQDTLIQYPPGKIGDYAIPNSVMSIENSAFDGCNGLISVTIPNSVTSIREGAFFHCSGLTSVTIPNSITSIGNSAFSFCRSLTSVTIPNSVTSIGNGAFRICSGLTSVTIPNSVTTIGDYAFDGCIGLTSVTIPYSVTSIGNIIFLNCSSLTIIDVDASNPNYSSVNGILFNKLQDTLIQYPSGKTGDYIIPYSVTSIGNFAFHGCSGLTELHVKAQTPPELGDDTFRDVSKTIPVYVCGTASAYQRAPGWNCFTNIVVSCVTNH